LPQKREEGSDNRDPKLKRRECMTNAEAAAHFTSLPANEPAGVLVVNGDTCSAEALALESPYGNGGICDTISTDFLTKGDENLVTAFTKW